MGQRTFTLIPKFPGRDDSPDIPPLRPMTSKQVQKAYKTANKGPRLSRAEIWKQEKAEQERIKKEFEREKAAAKAKVAREKKKQKESAEKEEKRKKGLPLVNVRPSQDTISWFVRGNGSARKRDAKGKDVRRVDTIEEETDPAETTTTDTVDDELQHPTKKVRALEIIREDERDTPDAEEGAIADDELPRPSPSPKRFEDIQEVEEELVEDIGGALVTNNPHSQHLLEKTSREESILDMEDELDADFEEELALEMLQDLEAAVQKERNQNSTNKGESAPGKKLGTSHRLAGTGLPLANRYEEDLGLHRPNPPSVNLIQPSLPEQPRQAPASPSPSPPRQAPPMSTQAILYNFDDFFPSSSQQARELEEELDDDIAPSVPIPLPPIVEEEDEEEVLNEEPDKPADPTLLPTLGPLSDSPSPPSRRFFTSSGSHELMCLAIHRSRRTAALETIQQRERSRVQAGMVARAEAESCKANRPCQPARTFQRNTGGYRQRPPQIQAPPVLHEKKNPPNYTVKERSNAPMARRFGESPKEVQRAEPVKPLTTKNNKENQKPPEDNFGPSASQESYGGDWVDEIALELMI
ncbi:hypothetical protein ACHAPT_005575 [Fusarium lateritium]